MFSRCALSPAQARHHVVGVEELRERLCCQPNSAFPLVRYPHLSLDGDRRQETGFARQLHWHWHWPGRKDKGVDYLSSDSIVPKLAARKALHNNRPAALSPCLNSPVLIRDACAAGGVHPGHEASPQSTTSWRPAPATRPMIVLNY